MIIETVAELEANKAAAGLLLVGGAAEFDAAAAANPKAHPAAFVIPLEETPGENPGASFVAQRVRAVVGVVLVVRNVADPRGEQALDALATLRKNVQTLLLGWAPADGYAPYERGRGTLMAIRDGHLWWQDAYATSYFIKA